jgi:hypothetical protein
MLQLGRPTMNMFNEIEKVTHDHLKYHLEDYYNKSQQFKSVPALIRDEQKKMISKSDMRMKSTT